MAVRNLRDNPLQRIILGFGLCVFVVFAVALLTFVRSGHANAEQTAPQQHPDVDRAASGNCPGPNPVQNWGFETGSLAYWTTTGTAFTETWPVQTGLYAARVAVAQNTVYPDTSTIGQRIRVPHSGGTLSFWYSARLHNTGGGQTQVHQYAHLTHSGGQVTIMDVMEDSNYNWFQRTADLTPYAGSVVTLTFGVNITVGDDGAGASLGLDDVTVVWLYPEFLDVPPGHTFHPHARALACRGIDVGYACGGAGEPCNGQGQPYFRPNSPIKRDDLAHMVAASAGFSEDLGPRRFQDVPPSNSYYAWVQRMANRGLIGGYQCGGPGEPCVPPLNLAYFRPAANATRGQIAKIVSNAAGYSDPPTGQMFEDVPPSQTFYIWVQRLAGRGVMGGYPCGGAHEPCGPGNKPYFRWQNASTRGQSAKITVNTFFPANQLSLLSR
jgi:hypothetical protein